MIYGKFIKNLFKNIFMFIPDKHLWLTIRLIDYSSGERERERERERGGGGRGAAYELD